MTAGEWTVTEPGVVHGMPNAIYHGDPVVGGSLSSTGARKLLPPSCPALFAWERVNPSEPKEAFDVGSAVHDALLGGGPEIVRVEADSWRTNAAKDAAEAARARGAVPILAAVHDEVKGIVAAVRAHPIAGRLLDPDNMVAEPSLFWTDADSRVNRRARLDCLHLTHGRRLIVPDLKSTRCAQKDKFAKSAADYGYHQQAAWYLDGIAALDIANDAVFVFVAVEKTPPYLVNVIQLDVTAMRIGAALNRRALDIYAECDSTGHWPGYSAEVELASLPAWYERAHEEDLIS